VQIGELRDFIATIFAAARAAMRASSHHRQRAMRKAQATEYALIVRMAQKVQKRRLFFFKV
jgi:hypothetical protein